MVQGPLIYYLNRQNGKMSLTDFEDKLLDNWLTAILNVQYMNIPCQNWAVSHEQMPTITSYYVFKPSTKSSLNFIFTHTHTWTETKQCKYLEQSHIEDNCIEILLKG